MADALAGAGLLPPVQALMQGFVWDVPSPAQSLPVEALDAGLEPSTGASPAMALGESPLVAPLAEAGLWQRQGFKVGTLGLMIGYADSSELTEVPPLHPLPNAPAWLLGMANLHGNTIVVFDLANYLRLDLAHASNPLPNTSISGQQMLLILSHGPDAAGVIIQGLPERLRLSPEHQTASELAPEILLPHVRGTFLIDEQIWFDLNHHSLLEALEQELQKH
ncbi:MAG: chemotaxis protein CheW [Pseudomonadota bacterium]|nr:chemotaxis protein CheW [Pseudomonadota bacterium]